MAPTVQARPILVAVEGVDGAGKNTLTGKVADVLRDRGVRLSRLAFPRYGTLHADLVAAALHNHMGDLVKSPYGMATLFALDRRAALHEEDVFAPFRAECVDALPGAGDDSSPSVLLLDRWVASNAAYSAARTCQPVPGEITEWVSELEFDRFHLPHPDLTILLDVPVELARQRAAQREQTDAARTRDVYERDSDLQTRTAQAYRYLASSHWGGEWLSVTANADPVDIADQILARKHAV